uniref:Uncharacterized protein n=1 Tax=Arundo donax TaxID=35708 RepID=A0A0A9HHG3_ARUDO
METYCRAASPPSIDHSPMLSSSLHAGGQGQGHALARRRRRRVWRRSQAQPPARLVARTAGWCPRVREAEVVKRHAATIGIAGERRGREEDRALYGGTNGP